jgi:hypothetical protein
MLLEAKLRPVFANGIEAARPAKEAKEVMIASMLERM